MSESETPMSYRRYPGRPLKFNDPQKLQEAVETYFDRLTVWNYAEGVDPVSLKPRKRLQRQFLNPPTMSGLAVSLGINRQSLIKYASGEMSWNSEPISEEVKKQLVDTIRNAHARVEEYGHEALYTAKSAVGPVFSLKNNHADWEDVSTIRNEHSLEQYDLSQLSDDELSLFVKLKEKALAKPENQALPAPSGLPAGLLVADAGREAVEAKRIEQGKEEERLQAEEPDVT